ncbi:thiol-disulfide oxidoreductase DCC family protein [Bacillus sp. Marseille-P3661]|uniref:thiol-disulfide oxidoreductase DCC family protein n=1 Tax=Bacillus sp. Marseille-P3661 TaxID=1936234 RepID=UPI000C834251|nr:DCC1-like thiol-disulfide oxidoreductase family protein [Bacillus sp. Marseille-P3661]
MNAVILFDGDCNFCDQSVQFILKTESSGYFKFASLQGKYADELLRAYRIPSNVDSLILIEDGRYYLKSTAALRISRKLKFPWRFLFVFVLIPARIRDILYDLFAKNRYKWFGKKMSCLVPSPEIRKRFLD